MPKPDWECTHYIYLECPNLKYPPIEIYLIADKRRPGYAVSVRPCQRLDQVCDIVIHPPVRGIFSEQSDAINGFEAALETKKQQGYEEKRTRIGQHVQLGHGDFSVRIARETHTFQLRALATEGPMVNGVRQTSFSLLYGDGWFVPFTRVVIAQTSLPYLKILSGVELVVLVQCKSVRRGRIEVSSFSQLLPAEEKVLCHVEQLAQLT